MDACEFEFSTLTLGYALCLLTVFKLTVVNNQKLFSGKSKHTLTTR